jgi:hypothetical protein
MELAPAKRQKPSGSLTARAIPPGPHRMLTVLPRRVALDRRGQERAVGHRAGAVPVLVTRRPKYACRICEGGGVQALAPVRPIEGGLPTEVTVAQVLVFKIIGSRSSASALLGQTPRNYCALSIQHVVFALALFDTL